MVNFLGISQKKNQKVDFSQEIQEISETFGKFLKKFKNLINLFLFFAPYFFAKMQKTKILCFCWPLYTAHICEYYDNFWFSSRKDTENKNYSEFYTESCTFCFTILQKKLVEKCYSSFYFFDIAMASGRVAPFLSKQIIS